MTTSAISLDRDGILSDASQRAEGLIDFGTGPFVANMDRFQLSEA